MRTAPLLAAISFVLCSSLSGASAPDWLQALAKKAPPEESSTPPAWVLLDETTVSINESGDTIEHRRVAVRLRTNSGSEFAKGIVYYNGKSDRVQTNKAWLVRNGSAVKDKSGSDWLDTENGTPGSIVDESRKRSINLAEFAVAGDVFGFETQVKTACPVAQFRWGFGWDIPVIEECAQFDLPPGFLIDASTQGAHPLVKSVNPASNSWSWTLHDPSYTPDEPCIAPTAHTDAWLTARIVPPSGNTKFKPATFASWSDVARWTVALNATQQETSPEISAKVRELTQNSPDTLGKIRALCAYVQNLRYVAANEGLKAGHGYQARKASLVFSRGFGDCKDKANLLCVMLREIGITAYRASALAASGFQVVESCPSPTQFNHAIAAIVVDDSVQLPTVVPTEKWGRLLFFDPTDPYTVVGDLPESIQGTKTHLMTEGSDSLITLPTLSPREGFAFQRKVRLALTPDGDIQASGTITGLGQAGNALRLGIKRVSQPSEMEALVSRQLSDAFRGATINDKKTSDDLVSGRCELSFDCTKKHYVQALPGGVSVVKLDVLSRQMLPIFSEKVRYRPIELPPLDLQDEVILPLPEGQVIEELPRNTRLESPYGTYALTCSTEAGVLTLHRTITLNKVEVPVADYAKLKKFFTDLARADRSSVLLKPKA